MTGLRVRKARRSRMMMLRLRLAPVMHSMSSIGVVKLERRTAGLKDTAQLPGRTWTFKLKRRRIGRTLSIERS